MTPLRLSVNSLYTQRAYVVENTYAEMLSRMNFDFAKYGYGSRTLFLLTLSTQVL